MMDPTSDRDGEEGGATSSSELEALVLLGVEAFERDGTAGVERVCAAAGAREAELLAILANLRGMGLLESERGDPPRFGDFRIISLLGSGGMGVVHLAEQVSLGRRVALKIMRRDALLFPGARQRFRREIAAVSRLQHPSIVQVLTGGEEDGIPYFAMELFEGATLAQVVTDLAGRDPRQLSGVDLARCVHAEAQGGIFSASWIEACFRIVRDIADALAHAHERGIVHRDVKPSNIAVTRDGRARLFDFGVAWHEGASPITQSGAQPGSLHYMSPEQARGRRDFDRRTDVYSLGVTLFELLTLRRPYAADDSEGLRRQIITGSPVSARRANPALSRDAEAVCATAMATDVERRYPDMTAFGRDLDNVLGLRSIEARDAGWRLRFRAFRRHHPKVVTAAGLVGIVTAALLVFELRGEWIADREVARHLALADGHAAAGRINESIEATGAALGVDPSSPRALARRASLLARAEYEAREARDEILRLADSKRLQDLLGEGRDLWPAFPELRSRISAWLARAHELRERAPMYRRSLLALGPPDAAEDTTMAWRRRVLGDLIADVEETLPSLVETVSELGSRIASVEAARRDAETAEAWRRAVSVVASHPLYSGADLRPIRDLVPIGCDRESTLLEFWHPLSGSRPVRDEDTGHLGLTGESGLVFVLVPGGTFALGSEPPPTPGTPDARSGDPWRRENEGPVRIVALAPFLLAKTEMTWGQWRCARGGARGVIEDGDRDPVRQISWDDVAATLARLELSIPTEPQWEYACRAGTTSVFHTGDDPSSLEGFANIMDAANLASSGYDMSFTGMIRLPQGGEVFDDGYVGPSPVASFGPNGWGFHDLHGNVWEWVRGAWTRSYDDVEFTPGDGCVLGRSLTGRAARGGSFASPFWMCRSATRSSSDFGGPVINQGVRPARSIVP